MFLASGQTVGQTGGARRFFTDANHVAHALGNYPLGGTYALKWVGVLGAGLDTHFIVAYQDNVGSQRRGASVPRCFLFCARH